VMFDERMTTFEYEFFNSLWRVTGVSPDRYELVLCVDADTKVRISLSYSLARKGIYD
jgi:chitin synthase